MTRSRWKMRSRFPALGFIGCLVLAPAAAAERVTLDLEAALLTAARRSPELRARRAEVDEARGRLLSARTYPMNPQFEVEAGRRRGPDTTTNDRGLSLSQELELGGQRGRRRDVAEARLAGAEARLLRQGRSLAARVELAFAEAVRARELGRVAELDARLAKDYLDLVERRLAAGSATQLDVNLARATRGRAERRLAVRRGAGIEARGRLAAAVGLDPGSLPAPVGELPLPAPEPPPLSELLRLAAGHRADLTAFRQERAAAEARLRLARADRVPNLSVSVSYEREEGTDEILGGGLGIALPVFDRNQGAIAEAEAARERSGHELAGLEIDVESEVVAAYATLTAAGEAAELLRDVLGSTEESLDLLRRAFEAGKIGNTELLLFRGELVESWQEYVETLAEAWRARIALDLATGRLASLDLHPEAEE